MFNYTHLKVDSSKLLISTESIVILPLYNSDKRNKEINNELLPAPVLPTTPIFSAGKVSNDTSLKDGAKCGLKSLQLLNNQIKRTRM